MQKLYTFFFVFTMINYSFGQSASDYFNTGLKKMKAKEYEEAVNNLDQSIKMDNDNSFAYANRGLALSAMGKNRQAISDYKKAIKLNPMNAKFYLYRGVAK